MLIEQRKKTVNSIDAEKRFDKTRNPFMIKKVPNKVEIEEKFLNVIKGIGKTHS